MVVLAAPPISSTPAPVEGVLSARRARFAPRPASGREPHRLRQWLRVSRGHGSWILLWSIVGWLGTLAAPMLADHPFVLMMLSPRALFVAMAADSVNIVVFVVAGTMRLAATDASYFILGRRFPRHGAHSVPPARSMQQRVRRRVARLGDRCCSWLCSHGLKAATVLFLRPNGKYLAVAGAYGVPASVAGPASVGGTVIYLALLYYGVGALI